LVGGEADREALVVEGDGASAVEGRCQGGGFLGEFVEDQGPDALDLS
jgi:hypothetical protein